MTMATTEIKNLESRLAKLERAVFQRPHRKESRAKAMAGVYNGLTGGIQLLIDHGFFKQPVLVTQVQDQLEEEGYFRPIRCTDAALRRFVKQKTLDRVKYEGVWQYVLRK